MENELAASLRLQASGVSYRTRSSAVTVFGQDFLKRRLQLLGISCK